MSAELVHDDYELRRLWHAANPGVTPTPWDTPPLAPRRLTLVPPPAPEPLDLAAYRRQRRPGLDGA